MADEKGTWSNDDPTSVLDGVVQVEPQYRECKRCHGMGDDEDGSFCIPCGGTGEIELL